MGFDLRVGAQKKELEPIVVQGFSGLNLKVDLVNRPPNSWRRLENCDLYVPGSIRKVFGPLKYGPLQPSLILNFAEYKPTGKAPVQLIGIGEDGNLYDLTTGTMYPTGIGPISDPPWMGMLPGTLIPFEFIAWQKTFAVTANEAVAKYSVDGNLYIFVAQNGGFTGAQEPTWPLPGGTVLDGGVTWSNIGLRDSVDFKHNYLVILPPTGQPVKFDGTTTTEIGVSAPGVQLGILNYKQTTSGARGITINAGRLYAWTWFNPTTLHESSPSPLLGSVTFFATDVSALVTKLGDFLPALVGNAFYSQVTLGIPAIAITPPIGSGYDHIRIYATKDGGAELFLIQTIYDDQGDVITDANGAISISLLGSTQDYSPIPITQAKSTQLTVNDGFDNGKGITTADDVVTTGNDGLIEGTTPGAVIGVIPGTLPADPNGAAQLDGLSGYIAVSTKVTFSTTFSIGMRIRTSATVGGVLGCFSSTQVGAPTGAQEDRYLWIDDDGQVHFAYFNLGTATWHKLNSIRVCNDGLPHQILVGGGPGGVSLFVDGDPAITNGASSDNNTFAASAFWKWGFGSLIERGFTAQKPSSDYYTGVLDEIFTTATKLVLADQTALLAAAGAAPPAYENLVLGFPAVSYWRLGDINSGTLPVQDASLVFPAPGFGEHGPPPIADWGTLYQDSFVYHDAIDVTKLWLSGAGDFESVGVTNFLTVEDDQDDPITALVGTFDRLIVGKNRHIASIYGNNLANFTRFPVDLLHGMLGRRAATTDGSLLVALMRQGLSLVSMTLSGAQGTGNVVLGFRQESVLGDAVLPITNDIVQAALRALICMAVDTTQNVLLFAIKVPGGIQANNQILMLQIGGNIGFSLYINPVVGVAPLEFWTIKEVTFPDGSVGILGTATDGNTYKLFNALTITNTVAVAETQLLPVPQQVGAELVNTTKTFKEVYVEGADLPNWQIAWSVDGGPFTVPRKLNPPLADSKGSTNIINGSGKQIVLQFTHDVRPPRRIPPVAPLISLYKIDYDIQGKQVA